jgi:hypothetical protein
MPVILPLVDEGIDEDYDYDELSDSTEYSSSSDEYEEEEEEEEDPEGDEEEDQFWEDNFEEDLTEMIVGDVCLSVRDVRVDAEVWASLAPTPFFSPSLYDLLLLEDWGETPCLPETAAEEETPAFTPATAPMRDPYERFAALRAALPETPPLKRARVAQP